MKHIPPGSWPVAASVPWSIAPTAMWFDVHVGGTTLRFKRAAFTLMCETLLSALSQVAPELTVVARIHGGLTQPNH